MGPAQVAIRPKLTPPVGQLTGWLMVVHEKPRGSLSQGAWGGAQRPTSPRRPADPNLNWSVPLHRGVEREHLRQDGRSAGEPASSLCSFWKSRCICLVWCHFGVLFTKSIHFDSSTWSEFLNLQSVRCHSASSTETAGSGEYRKVPPLGAPVVCYPVSFDVLEFRAQDARAWPDCPNSRALGFGKPCCSPVGHGTQGLVVVQHKIGRNRC